MKIGAQLAVAHARFDRDRTRLLVQRNDPIHGRQGEEMHGAIGNAVEAMTRAEHLELGVLFDEFLDLRDRPRQVQLVGPVVVIAGPILQLVVGFATTHG
jgi:hypothetical protein